MRRIGMHLLSLLRSFRRPIEEESALDDEMRLHREHLREKYERQGMNEDDARFRASRQFGNATLLREAAREMWGLGTVERLWQDVRYGLRLLRLNKAFTLTALIALALGIGANTAIFSVVYSVLFRPLPYGQPQHLMTVLQQGRSPVSPHRYYFWKESAHSFESLAAATPSSATIEQGTPDVLNGIQSTGNLFQLLGVKPMLGRMIEPADEANDSPVVVLTYGLWQRRFGGDRSVLGRKITMMGIDRTIVGVMPPQFYFAPFWARGDYFIAMPLAKQRDTRRNAFLRVFGRLKRGVDADSAQAEMRVLDRRMAELDPVSYRDNDTRVVSLQRMVTGEIQLTLLVLLATAGCLLLITCSNVANLMLARAAARKREFAIRSAIGGGMVRLFRQLITESTLLALLGGGFGLALAYAGVRAIPLLLPPDSIPRQQELQPDLTLFLVAGLLTLITGVIAGMIPAWQTTRGNLADSLQEGARGGASRQSVRTRRLLIASECALAVLLLATAALLGRSFERLVTIDPGFETRRILSFEVSVAGSTHASSPERRIQFYNDVIANLHALPGVEAVSAINHLPLAGDEWGLTFTAPDQPDEFRAVYRVAMPGYFETMRIRFLAGHGFTTSDRVGAPPVTVVNETLARELWPGKDPIGRAILRNSPGGQKTPVQVIGVVKDPKQSDWAGGTGGEIYFPFLQEEAYLSDPATHFSFLTFVVRTSGDPAKTIGPARQAVWAVDPHRPVSHIVTMPEVTAGQQWRERTTLLLVGMFSLTALILAITGIYGVITHAMTERTREFGVRTALGARPGDLAWLALRGGLTPVFAGAGVGTLLALAAGRMLSGLLYDTSPRDPTSLAAAGILLVLAAGVAALLPARRAALADPITALRQ